MDSLSSRASEEPREFHSWINIVIAGDGGKSRQGCQELRGASAGSCLQDPTSWGVPGTSPGLPLVYVESVVLKSDLKRAFMNALGIQSSG